MSSRTRILEKAKDLFHKKGASNTSIEDIASGASVTKSNLYYHFRNKEALILEALENRISEFEKNVIDTTLSNPSFSPCERIKRFYQAVIEYHESLRCEGGCPFGNMALELGDSNTKVRYLLEDFFNRWRGRIEDCFREGVSVGEFRDDFDSYEISDLILSHLEGAIMMVKVRKSVESLKKGSLTILRLLSKRN